MAVSLDDPDLSELRFRKNSSRPDLNRDGYLYFETCLSFIWFVPVGLVPLRVLACLVHLVHLVRRGQPLLVRLFQ